MPPTARCLNCGYLLAGLPEPRCPECGRSFDPANPYTYSTLPLFVRWKFYLPGLLLAVGAGAFLWALLFKATGVGVALTLVSPFSFGAILGYLTRARTFLLIFLALLALGVVSFLMLTLRLEGIFCALVLACTALVPLLVGAAIGIGLRTYLKRTRFSQKDYLPILIFFALPLGWATVEVFTPRRYPPVSVVTSVDMPVGREQAWYSVLFYEEVKHAPPLLLRLGLSRPLDSYGSAAHVGDTKTCVYDSGKLVKRITRVEPGKALEFDVIDQQIETCAVKLKRGSFRFDETSPGHTRVTLTTEYEPILSPRFAWQPWEETSAHTLHRHVLAGMQMKAESHSPATAHPESLKAPPRQLGHSERSEESPALDGGDSSLRSE